MIRLGYLLIISSIFSGCLVIKQPQPIVKKPVTNPDHRSIDMEEMVRRFISKTGYDENSLEGIYTVSAEVTRKGKGLLSKEERERIVDKKNNYATVAILRDWPDSNTEYVEISLGGDSRTTVPIISEITSLSGGRGFIVEHIDKGGKKMPFTFATDGPGHEVLEGVYEEAVNNGVVTYKLSYLKTYPKNRNFQQSN